MFTIKQFATILFTGFTLFFYSQAVYAIEEPDDQQVYKQLEIFSSVLSTIQENYIQEVDSGVVLDGAIRGLLSTLDPHSSYLTPEEFLELQEETTGSFSGIGIEVTTKDNVLTVISPIDGTPGEKAGIQAQDQIIEINGKKTSELGAQEAIKRLRGPQGSEITLSLKRPGKAGFIKVTVTRENIPIQSVKFLMLPSSILYTRITSFQGNTSHDYVENLKKITESSGIRGAIIDLRNNPGGLLSQAIGIADLFLTSGRIVSTKGRSEDQNMVFNAHNVGESNDFPLVVLINGGSASASEIVAGALQAHKRAIILGTQSFGKGSVQSIIPLPNGAGLRITTAKYYTPDDRSIQALGITPDVEVPDATASQNMVSEEKQVTAEADLENHFKNGDNPKVAKVESTEEEKEIDDLLKKDNQLRSAYNILKSVDMYTNYTNTRN